MEDKFSRMQTIFICDSWETCVKLVRHSFDLLNTKLHKVFAFSRATSEHTHQNSLLATRRTAHVSVVETSIQKPFELDPGCLNVYIMKCVVHFQNAIMLIYHYYRESLMMDPKIQVNCKQKRENIFLGFLAEYAVEDHRECTSKVNSTVDSRKTICFGLWSRLHRRSASGWMGVRQAGRWCSYSDL